MPNYSLDHIHVKAIDVDRTVQWYVDNLGAKIVFEGIFMESKVFYLDLGFSLIVFGRLNKEWGDDGIERPENEPIEPLLRSRYGVDHFGVAVDDIQEAVADLTAKGVRVLYEPWSSRKGVTITYIEGPDAVRIELTERHEGWDAAWKAKQGAAE